MSIHRPVHMADDLSRPSEARAPDLALLSEGDLIEVEWPCVADEGATRHVWFSARLAAIRPGRRSRFCLRFDDGGEAWNSLSSLRWRRVAGCECSVDGGIAAPSADSMPDVLAGAAEVTSREGLVLEEVRDGTGFVHSFTIDGELLHFCDELHERRAELGDRTRGDALQGERLAGGLVSVVVRRDALPPRERELYMRLHHACAEEVPRAWPDWLRRAAGRSARARPSQDLRLLQYSEGANFKPHVDSGWACQALVYLNEDFDGGFTEFPALHARYKPKRGSALLWRSVCVGHRAAAPGCIDDHPALHVAAEVFGGTKRVVSIHLVLA